MAGAASKGDDGLMSEINVTPLVDVVLVLLVLMMVTATAIASKTLGVEVPKAKTGASSPARPLVVALDERGAFLLEGREVDEATIRTRARTASDVVLAADKKTRHELVVHALDVLRSEQVAKVAIVVRSESAQ